MANALRPLPTSSHSDRTLWALDCGPGDCATQHIDAVTLTTSSDVFIRSATPREREASAATSIALLATGGVSSDGVSSVDLGSDGLRTLTVAAFSDDVELVVLRDTKLQRVEVQGSGTVAVDDHVLATGGKLYLSAAGSADIFAQSTDAMDLTSIYVINQGSENVQLSLGRVRVEQVTLSDVNSGDISLLTEEVDVSDVGALDSSGAGTICWAASASATISSLKISGVSSGDIDVAAPGSCTTVKISSAGSGRIDTGSTRCNSASVSVFGSGQVVVQATDAISGTSVGSGSVKYVGSTPRSMGSSFPGGYSGYPFSSKPLAKPVGSSYSLPTCRKRDMPQVRHHGLVGDLVAAPDVRIVSLPPVNTAPSIDHQPSPTIRATPPIDHQPSPTEGATSPIESPADEPQLPTPSSDEPWEKVAHHYAALLPLAAVALIAALVLWRFNENQRRERRRRLEQQPLVSEHRPVYI